MLAGTSKETVIALQANTSDSEDEGSAQSEDEIAMLTRKFKGYLQNKKRNFQQKQPKGKARTKENQGEVTCYECKKPGHMKWECPNSKSTKDKKEEREEPKYKGKKKIRT